MSAGSESARIANRACMCTDDESCDDHQALEDAEEAARARRALMSGAS